LAILRGLKNKDEIPDQARNDKEKNGWTRMRFRDDKREIASDCISNLRNDKKAVASQRNAYQGKERKDREKAE